MALPETRSVGPDARELAAPAAGWYSGEVLSSIRYQDFRVFADATLELAPLTVLVGPNGAGKSTALDGLWFIAQGFRQDTGGEGWYPRYRDALLLIGGGQGLLRQPSCNQFTIELNSDGARARLVGIPKGSPTRVLRMEVRAGVNEAPLDYPLQGSAIHADRWHTACAIPGFFRLDTTTRLRLDAAQLSAPHYSDADIPALSPDGTGLATALQYLQGARDGRLEAIEAHLHQIVPGAKRIRTLPARVRRTRTERISIGETTQLVDRTEEVTGARFELEIEPYGWIPANALSEGTLLTLGLLTVLHHQRPRLILLDDLDMGLHPRAQQDMVKILRDLVEQEDLQIVCTTHSPFVVDAFKIEEVRVFGLGPDGYARIKNLQDHPQWAKRSGYMKPGEFWSGVGEAWVGQ